MSTEKRVFAILKKISKQDKVKLSAVADLETSYNLYSDALVSADAAIGRVKDQYEEITAMLSDLNYELSLYENIKAEMEDLRMSTSDALDEVTIKVEELGINAADFIPEYNDIILDLGANIDDDILRDALELATGY